MAEQANDDGDLAAIDPNKHGVMTVGGDTVKVALRGQVAREEITTEQEATIWWLYAFAREQGWDLVTVAREVGVHSTTLYRVFNGKYGAKVDSICEEIARFRKLAEERATIRKVPYVETSIARTVWAACDAALLWQTVVMVFGDSQIGKTTAAEEYARQHNHGQTKFVRMPASSGVQLFAREFARACYVSPRQSFEGLRESILNALDDKTLVIVDEIHQVFSSCRQDSQVKVLEFIREVYDRKKCGLVLIGTHVFETELMQGKLKHLMEQLRRRCTHRVVLPKRPPARDVAAFARAFGLAAPEGEAAAICDDMIHSSGLGMLVKYLQAANRMAGKQKKPLTWDHFVAAHDLFAKLSAGGK